MINILVVICWGRNGLLSSYHNPWGPPVAAGIQGILYGLEVGVGMVNFLWFISRSKNGKYPDGLVGTVVMENILVVYLWEQEW